MTTPQLRQLVLTFGDDAGPEADSAIELAAELAARFALELRACVVQDTALLDVAALPFTRRFVSTGGSARAQELSPALVRAAWRRRAERSRASLENAARRHRLAWSFEVVSRPDEPGEGQLAVLVGSKTPASARGLRLSLIEDPSERGRRARELAQSLAGDHPLQRVTWSDADLHADQLRARLRQASIDVLVVPARHPVLRALLDRQGRPLPCTVLAVG